jgi:hypothetical protein
MKGSKAGRSLKTYSMKGKAFTKFLSGFHTFFMKAKVLCVRGSLSAESILRKRLTETG